MTPDPAAPPSRAADSAAPSSNVPTPATAPAPGDGAPPGTPGTGEAICSHDERPWPFPTADHHAPADPPKPLPHEPSEAALDHGIDESFPASDPLSVTVTTVPPPTAPDAADDVPAQAPPLRN